MTQEQFKTLIRSQQIFESEAKKWDELGINIYESDLLTSYYDTFNTVLKSIFTEVGEDYINWWLFERVDFHGKINKMWDANNKEIPLDTIDDLWNLVSKCIK